MSHKRAKQKFNEAIFAMAVNPDSLQQRVINTYRSVLSQLTMNEIPAEIRDEYRKIKSLFVIPDSKMDANEIFETLSETMTLVQAKLIADKTLEMRHIIKHYE